MGAVSDCQKGSEKGKVCGCRSSPAWENRQILPRRRNRKYTSTIIHPQASKERDKFPLWFRIIKESCFFVWTNCRSPVQRPHAGTVRKQLSVNPLPYAVLSCKRCRNKSERTCQHVCTRRCLPPGVLLGLCPGTESLPGACWEQDSDYQMVERQIDRLCQEILKQLGEGQRSLLLRVEGAVNHRALIAEGWVYCQGLRDSTGLLKWMGTVLTGFPSPSGYMNTQKRLSRLCRRSRFFSPFRR